MNYDETLASAVGRVLTECTEDDDRIVLKFEGGHTYVIRPCASVEDDPTDSLACWLLVERSAES